MLVSTVENALCDESEVYRTLELLHPRASSETYEIRVLFDGFALSGYFGAGNSAVLCTALREIEVPKGIYITLNPVHPHLLARMPGRLQRISRATDDTKIVRRRHLLLDVDPVRDQPNATDTEKACARRVADAMRDYLRSRGLDPRLADSGNGYHLYLAVDLPNDEATRLLVRDFLRGLAALFDTDAAQVDVNVYNASRLTKLIGTLAAKGPPSPERPQRRSGWIDDPLLPGLAAPEQLAAIAALAPAHRAFPATPARAYHGDVRPWARAIIEGELGALRGTPAGRRNNALNRHSFKLGQLVGSGEAIESEVRAALYEIAEQWPNFEQKSRKTIDRALAGGIKQPRRYPGSKGSNRDGVHPHREREHKSYHYHNGTGPSVQAEEAPEPEPESEDYEPARSLPHPIPM